MNLKVTDSLQTKKQEKTFLFMLQESTRKNLREGDRVSYEEEEGRKGKLLRK
jgi:cold shock CspA family protein